MIRPTSAVAAMVVDLLQAQALNAILSWQNSEVHGTKDGSNDPVRQSQ